ncbi:FimV/HubP family polar landmark protein [Pseudomonas sp. TCU-HL1]|uniref:FimV/HubP family polar landmark protein n=1 Tax=Pseudomonas sp. TCU-HL1 TaxID=1856685 RepID=UPI000857712A|nr:FimV/HubP family polar landmark protein [Pseudomonas sp. TCU-HL1]AOE84441.1 Motility protein FimV [Pseudomonas sp. TCU-HL1]
MARVHKLLLTLASGSALYSGLVPALGLGEITLHSALNQPLDAEIELLEVGDLNDSEIKVSLASADAFEHAGVDRFLFLNDLRFSPVIRGAGSRIRVVSNKPVREPYLNFIIEVARPNGKLLREYTLLLDPPGSVFTAGAAPVSPVRSVSVATSSSPPVQPKPAPAAAQGKYYQVARGDSLWRIARRLSAGSRMSQQQMLDGIYALNAQAFPGGDINHLRVGQSLLLPDDAVLASQPAAVVATAPAAPASQAPVSAATTPPSPTLVELTQVQQRVDTSIAQGEAERAQLRQDIAELQARLEVMQKQLSGSDQQMTELQTQVQQIAATPAPAIETPQVQPVREVSVIPAAQAAEQSAPAQASSSGISPFWWAIMVSGLVLLFLLDWVLLRRSRREAQQQELEEAQATGKAKVAFQHRHQDIQPAAPAKLEPAPVAAKATVAREVVSLPSAKVHSDALEGANIYIAYGRWREALAVLRSAVAQDPQRLELRYRLLEVLGELRDPVAFTLEEAALRDLHADDERLAAIRAGYADLASTSTPVEPVFVLDESTPASASASNEPIDSLPSDFDGYPLDADWEQVSPFKPAEPKRKAAVVQAFPTVEEDVGFPTNLQELPEVFELTLDADTLSPFGELPELTQAESLDELTVDFIDPMVSLDDLDKLDARQENLTKLNLALAYIEQGNIEAACSILNEVISEGDDQQKQEARDLLAKIA